MAYLATGIWAPHLDTLQPKPIVSATLEQEQ